MYKAKYNKEHYENMQCCHLSLKRGLVGWASFA